MFYKLALAFISFFIPISFSFFTENVFVLTKTLILNIILFFVYIYWTAEEVKNKKNTVDFNFLTILLVLYVLDTAISSVFSVSPILSRNDFLVITSLFLLFYFVSNKFSRKDIGFFIKPLFFSGVLISIYAVFQFMGFDFISWEPKELINIRPIGTFENPIFLSNFMAIIAPLAAFYYFESKEKLKSILYLFMFTLFYSVIYMTFSRGGWMALGAALVLLIVVGARRAVPLQNKFKAIVLLLLIIVIPLFIYALPVSRKTDKIIKIKTVEAINSRDTNISARLYLWKSAANIIFDSPFFGKGADTFSYTYTKYRYLEPVEMRGLGRVPGRAHNQFLEHALTGGIPLLILFILIVYNYYGCCLSDYKKNENKNFSICLMLAGTSYIVGMFFVFGTIALDVIWFILLGFCAAGFGNGRGTTCGAPTNKHKFIIIFMLILATFNLYNTSRIWQADYYYKKALIQKFKNNKEAALKYIDKSISINSYSPKYFEEKGRISESLFQSSRAYLYYQKSRDAYYKAIELNPIDPYLWINPAKLNADTQRIINCPVADLRRESVKCYLQALFLDPYNPAFLNDMGAEFYYGNHKKLAYNYYADSLKIYPYSAVVNTNLALIYISEGKYKLAKKYIEEALRCDKNFTPAKEILEKIKGKHKQ